MTSPQRVSQDGEQHGQTPPVPADHGAPRRAERARPDQRLDLDQQRARALDPGEHRGPGHAGLALGEERAEDGHLDQTALGHLEHADLVGRAEPVLDRAQDPELMAALAFEIDHGVDHVLEHPRPGDLAVLGHVPDQQERRAAPLGEADQLVRARRSWVTVPGAASTLSTNIVWIESITTSPARGRDRRSRGCRGPRSPRSSEPGRPRPQAGGAQPDLVDRLLAADVGDLGPRHRKRRRRLEHEGRLADPGSPPIRTVEPGTRPPPSTRSSSAIAVVRRDGPADAPASPTSSSRLAAPARSPLGAGSAHSPRPACSIRRRHRSAPPTWRGPLHSSGRCSAFRLGPPGSLEVGGIAFTTMRRPR